MSVLLTNEAVRVAVGDRRGRFADAITYALNRLLRFHATEGREALIEELSKVCVTWKTMQASDGHLSSRELEPHEIAEAVVTHLFGEAR